MNFTNQEKKECIDVLKTIPKDKRAEFLRLLSNSADAIVSKRTFWGAAKGFAIGLAWDICPLTEFLTGFDDEVIMFISTAIGGYKGARKEYDLNQFEKIKQEVMQ